MRITSNMMHDLLLGNVSENTNKFHKIQQQISSEKRYQTDSEDPIGSAIANTHRISEQAYARYLDNLDDAEAYLKATESSMSQLNEIVVRAMEIAEYNSTETSNGESRDIATTQVDELIQQSFDVANSEHRDRYLFSGFNTDEPAYGNDMKILPVYKNANNQYQGNVNVVGEYNSNSEAEFQVRISESGTLGEAKYQVSEDGGITWSDSQTIYSQVNLADQTNSKDSGLDITFESGDFAEGDIFKVNIVRGAYSGDNGEINYNIGKANKIQTNVNGEQLFENNKYFDTLYKLKFALKNDSNTEISDSLESLKNIQEDIQNQTAKVGSKLNVIEMTRNNIETQKLNLTEAISDIENTDMVSAISELSRQESTLQASISVLSKVMQSSLLNYI